MSSLKSFCRVLIPALAACCFLTGCPSGTDAPEKPESPGNAAKPEKPATRKADGKTAASVGKAVLSADRRTLVKYDGNDEKYTIPAGVTAIGDKAFAGSRDLTVVVIPDGVTSIGEGAFYGCQNLRDVTIPSSVTSIGKEAFWWCSNLNNVTIPVGVTSIGEGAFGKCGLMSLTIPSSVSCIGSRAFAGCTALASADIPRSVVIGEGAFNECPCEALVKEHFPSYKR